MLGDGQCDRDARRLQHGAAAETHGGRARLAPEDAHLAALHGQAAQQQGYRRRLAGPVRTEHGQHLARPDVEVQPVERDDVAVAVVNARELCHALVARLLPWCPGGYRHPAMDDTGRVGSPVVSRVSGAG